MFFATKKDSFFEISKVKAAKTAEITVLKKISIICMRLTIVIQPKVTKSIKTSC